MRLPHACIALIFLTLLTLLPALAWSATVQSGAFRRWHPVVLTCTGPASSEGAAVNPFTDFRLDVTFTKGGRSLVVPGYYAADGNAGETSASSGNVWRAIFTPDEVGTWTWRVSFRSGSQVAAGTTGAGVPAGFCDGDTGTVTIADSDKSGVDFRGKGFLRYVGGHYPRFDNGEHFIKAGPGDPENFLGFNEFDNTPGARHTYAAHVRDWTPSDPTWQGGKGKGIVGLINYLSSRGVNTLYFMTWAGGDGLDAFPWITLTGNFTRYDCSKLDQWDVVFRQMTAKGIHLHLFQQEEEIDLVLDGGALGNTRRIYYRELVARFGYHPALTWNIGEEINRAGNTSGDPSTAQVKSYCDFIRALDPYDHPIAAHPFGIDALYTPLLGHPTFEAATVQTDGNLANVHPETLKWRSRSAAAGRPWLVSNDEQGGAGQGIDANQGRMDEYRKQVLWGTLTAGGWGAEYYLGPDGITINDFRPFDQAWADIGRTLAFFRANVPFQTMVPADGLTSATNDFVLARTGGPYLVYLPNGGTTTLDLTGVAGNFAVRWFNPRADAPLQIGSLATISGGGPRSIGNPPAGSGDFAALITSTGAVGNLAPSVVLTSPATGATFTAPATITLTASANDSDGTITSVQFLSGGSVLATQTSPPFSFTLTGVAPGTLALAARATDNSGAVTTSVVATVTVNAVGAGPTVSGFTLIDATSDLPVAGFDPLPAGMVTLSLAALPPLLALRANVAGTVGSVRFAVDGNANFSTESTAPFATFGDSGGNFAPWTLNVGTHTITATAFTGSGATGTAGAALSTTLILQAVAPPVGNLPPTVTLTSPANGATFTAPATITLTAAASDGDGTVSSVQFLSGASVLATQTTPPFSFTLTGIAPGTLALAARATDNLGAVTTSAVVTVTVTAPPVGNLPPTVTLTSPANGATFTAPATITLTAAASDGDGTVSSVQFLSGASVLATQTTPPFSFTLTGVAPGTLALAARATDNLGAVTTSAVVTVTVQAANGPTVTGFTLINAANELPVAGFDPLPAGTVTLNLAALPPLLALRANVAGTVGSVRFALDGSGNFRTENAAPFALFGDTAGDFNPWNLAVGTHAITATAFSGGGATGSAGAAVSTTLILVSGAPVAPN